jgi:hypothetical protein
MNQHPREYSDAASQFETKFPLTTGQIRRKSDNSVKLLRFSLMARFSRLARVRYTGPILSTVSKRPARILATEPKLCERARFGGVLWRMNRRKSTSPQHWQRWPEERCRRRARPHRAAFLPRRRSSAPRHPRRPPQPPHPPPPLRAAGLSPLRRGLRHTPFARRPSPSARYPNPPLNAPARAPRNQIVNVPRTDPHPRAQAKDGTCFRKIFPRHPPCLLPRASGRRAPTAVLPKRDR